MCVKLPGHVCIPCDFLKKNSFLHKRFQFFIAGFYLNLKCALYYTFYTFLYIFLLYIYYINVLYSLQKEIEEKKIS